MTAPTPTPAPDTLPALADTTIEAFETRLADVVGDRPMTGAAAAGWTVMAIGFTAAAGVIAAIVLGTLLALITQSAGGAAIGAIIGLLLSLKIPARPHRDWRRRLKTAGFDVERLASGATDVRLGVEGLPARYRFAPGADRTDTVHLELGLPANLHITPGGPPTGHLAFDAHFGVAARPLQLLFVDTSVREALLAVPKRAQVVDGVLCLTVERSGMAIERGDFARLIHALRQLAADLAAPRDALPRIARGAPIDAAPALAYLLHQDIAVDVADPALVAFVAALLAGDAPAAFAEAALDWSTRAAVVTGLTRPGSVISVDALHAAAADRAARCAADEAGRLEATSLALAARLPDLVPCLMQLGRIGGHETAVWLSRTTFPPAARAIATEARRAIQARLQLGGALALDEDESRGAMAVVDNGQLSEADGSSK